MEEVFGKGHGPEVLASEAMADVFGGEHDTETGHVRSLTKSSLARDAEHVFDFKEWLNERKVAGNGRGAVSGGSAASMVPSQFR